MAVAAILVAAAAATSTWNTHRNSLVWDDRAAIVANNDVRGTHSLLEVFTHDFWGTPIRSIDSHKSYRPLTVLSFRLNHALAGGVYAHHFHATNAIVHVGCALLVWRVAGALFRKFDATDQASSDSAQDSINVRDASAFTRLGAVLAGLVFAVHPIHSDVVASIVGRADLLCTLLSLLAFWWYMRAVEQPAHTKWRAFVAALAFAVAASLCKELGFTTLGLFLAYDVIVQIFMRARRQHTTSATTNALEDVSASAAAFRTRAATLTIVTFTLTALRVWINGPHRQRQWNVLANDVAAQHAQQTRLLSYAHVHAWYLYKLLWPRALCFDYGFQTVPLVTTLADVANLYTLAAYALVACGVAVGARTVDHSPVLMCIAFGVIPFIPASNALFPVGTVVAERLLYLPSVGYSLLVGYVLATALCIAYRHGAPSTDDNEEDRTEPHKHLLEATLKPQRRTFFRWCYSLMTLSTLALVVSGCYRTQVRNAEWRDEATLFRAALHVAPTNAKVLSNVAKTLLGHDNAMAVTLARMAATLVPQQTEAHTNVGLAHWHLRNTLFAARHLFKSAWFSTNSEFQGKGYAGSALLDHWLALHGVAETQIYTMRDAFTASPTIRMAQALLDAAIRDGSFQPIHFYTRARLAYMANEPAAAVAFCHMALRANARVLSRTIIDRELVMSPGQIHNLIVITWMGQGPQQYAQALQAVAAGIDAAPHDLELRANAVMLHAELQDGDRALHHLQALLALATSKRAMQALALAANAMTLLERWDDARVCQQRLKQLQVAADTSSTDGSLVTEPFVPLTMP